MSDREPDAPAPLPPVLEAALVEHGELARAAFMEHLHGGTSAEWLSRWLKRAGTPVGATTIKDYRRTLNE